MAAAQEPKNDLSSRNLKIHTADRVLGKASIRSITTELGRSPSTISQEIRRNRTVLPSGQWHYQSHAAHREQSGAFFGRRSGRSVRTQSFGTWSRSAGFAVESRTDPPRSSQALPRPVRDAHDS
ncbi:helix-turn-helix domain-containing protein [Streptomyces virginiae]